MEKRKAYIIDGPQIRKLMKDQTFTTNMIVAERAAWCSYVSVIREFLGNTKASNYRNLVDVMLQNFQALGERMSIKLHYPFSHLDYFPENLGDVSDETRGEVLSRYSDDDRKIPRSLGLSHDGRLLLDTDS